MPFDSGCKAAPQSADTHCQIGSVFPQNICENTSQRKWKSRRFQCTLPSCGSTGEIELPFLSVQHHRIRRIPFHQCFPFSACFRPVSAPPEQHIPLSRFCFPAAQPAADCRPFAVPPEKPKHLTIKKTHLFISDTAAFFTPLKIPSLWIQSSSPKCCTFSKSFFDL